MTASDVSMSNMRFTAPKNNESVFMMGTDLASSSRGDYNHQQNSTQQHQSNNAKKKSNIKVVSLANDDGLYNDGGAVES